MRTLIHRTLLAVLLVTGTSFIQAQDEEMPPPSEERMKEIKAQKSAYLTTKLSLTPEQAQNFWPIYNQFDEERETLRRSMRDQLKDARKEGSTMTEAQASELLEKGLMMRQRELDLERGYMDRFKKSIGAVKTVELHKAERDFNKEVVRRYRERMEGHKGAPGGQQPMRHQ
ncbi:MAG TPA: hypothetical protein VKG92_11885 [Flavobacteriales bacterium]|nr:hypothetical protein [Flavobacteriales bacterium]